MLTGSLYSYVALSMITFVHSNSMGTDSTPYVHDVSATAAIACAVPRYDDNIALISSFLPGSPVTVSTSAHYLYLLRVDEIPAPPSLINDDISPCSDYPRKSLNSIFFTKPSHLSWDTRK